MAVASAVNVPATGADEFPLFRSFEVAESEANASPIFMFSEAYATSRSPVVITVNGRTLTPADKVHRVGLQKYWLSVNVPSGYQFQSRALVECALKRSGEAPYCDRYVFIDPETQRQNAYYIYVGNWP